ncbi:YceI family protein [Nonomuraea sp. NPDC050556]|uniref:YceI family protein n=1 Tax=Nonomuraea sp. NPDC050556 TaxID=3364369 RepID=UPI0037B6C805
MSDLHLGTGLGELTGDYVLDPAGTRIGFVGRHTMASRVRGRFDAFEGSAHLDGDDPSRSGVRLTIEAGSIRTGNRRRDDQLAASFLDADAHPAITFVSTRVEPSGGTTYRVTGDLTVRGTTRPVTVTFALTGTGAAVRFTGSAVINRMDWGANWNAATAVLVSKEITLDLDVSATRRARSS